MSRGALLHVTAVLFVALLLASCGGAEQGLPPAPQETTSAATTRPDGDMEAEGPAANAGEEPSWSGADRESGGNEGAADRLRKVEFDVQEGYERVRIAFGSGEGGASGIPRWSLEKAPKGGYVRLYLPGVTSTRTAGEDLAGLAADAYYVVGQPEGSGLFVDVVALGAFEYRVTELGEAGQLAIDFRRAPGGLACPVVQDDDTVVTQPCEAEDVAAGEPLAVEGYARDPGGTLTLVLLNEEGAPIAEETARVSDGNEAWRHFESSVAVPPSYEGLATLQVVGDGGPDEGASARTEVPVFVGVGQDG